MVDYNSNRITQKMRLYKLDKTIIVVTNNPTKLLFGITTNTLDQPKNAFLDIYGKIIATFEQRQISQDKIIIVMERKFLDMLINHLDKYLGLAKAKIEILDYNVYYNLDNDYEVIEGEFIIPQKNGQIIITKKQIPNQISEQDFTFFRLHNNIPIHGIDYNNEMILNVSEEFVSYTKGCYLGQEIISRVHNLGKPPKKLTVKHCDECNTYEGKNMTSKCKDENGRMFGFIFVATQPLQL